MDANVGQRDSHVQHLEQLCKEARSLWLKSAKVTDLIEVEKLYRSVWESTHNEMRNSSNVSASAYDVVHQQAGEKLAMILLQSRRPDEANSILKVLNFTCRLSSSVLNYPTGRSIAFVQQPRSSLSNTAPCRIWDQFLSKDELNCLLTAFYDPNAHYWTSHQYAVEPPSPYFSYLIPLDPETGRNEYGTIGSIIRRIQRQIAEWKPLVQQCTYCEMWAHNRPHATGHQLHFDSDNEGDGDVIRNPLVSTILYLTPGNDSVGGPSLITNQRRSSQHLADQGWYTPAVYNRLVAFDGKVLHGVIPGKGVAPVNQECMLCLSNRRVTLMLAFWKRITVRDDPAPGAGRPFPKADSGKEWADILTSVIQPMKTLSPEPLPIEAVVIHPIYETLDGKPWTRRMGLPGYEQVFQGF